MTKRNLVGFLLTNDELKVLNEYCSALQLSKSDLMREAIFEYINGGK